MLSDDVSQDEKALWRFFYVSRLCTSPLGLDELLDVSRRNNAAHAITGLLMFSGGHFAQFVEGPRAKLDVLLAALRRDPRHDRFTLHLYDQTPQRSFRGWSMGYVASPAMDQALMAACGRAMESEQVTSLMDRLFFDPGNRVSVG